MRTISTENAMPRGSGSRRSRNEIPGEDRSLKNYLYFWDTYTLYATVHPAAELHTHTTASITISLDEKFKLETAGTPAREYRAVFVPPGVAHRVTSPRIRRVVVQLEPGSPLFYQLGMLLAASGPTELDVDQFQISFDELRFTLAPAFRGRLSCEDAHLLFFQTLRAITGGSVTGPASKGLRDPRVARILKELRAMQELPAGLTAGHLARSVNLSTEHFRHLFKAEMGLPVRRYLLWLRIRRAGIAVAAGVSLTEAAHSVGFYDSAHLSRTCKEMLGFPPSFLTGRYVEMINCACSAETTDAFVRTVAGIR